MRRNIGLAWIFFRLLFLRLKDRDELPIPDCTFQKARPSGILLFEKSKSGSSRFSQRARNQALQAMFSLLAGQLCKMNFIAGHLSGLWNSGNFRLNLTKTAFNLEWVPNIIVRSRFELRSEIPTTQDFLQLSGGVLPFSPQLNAPTPPMPPSPSAIC